MIPEEFTVFDPEYAIRGVIDFTHYQPSHWENRLHSDDVRQEFSQLYKLKVLVFLEEVLSMITTPFILCFSLPDCSERIVDFVREFTVHVDGLGYVCSFAVFDFERGGNTPKLPKGMNRDGKDLREEYYATKDGKMLASYYNFMDHYVPNHGQDQPSSRGMRPTPSQQNYQGATPSKAALDTSAAALGRHVAPLRDRFPSRYGPNITTAIHKPSRLVGSAANASLMTSVLLDPQHQPSSLHLTSRSGGQSRIRQSRKPIDDLVEGEENETAEDDRPAGQSENLEEEQSHLGESWKMSKAGSIGEVDDGARGPATNAENGAGILGLVYQFSKAQTEGRTAGV
jgi:autophagy-related protein 9